MRLHQATADENELVALEACEFWSAICETGVMDPVMTQMMLPLMHADATRNGHMDTSRWRYMHR